MHAGGRGGTYVTLALYVATVAVLFIVPPGRTLHAESSAIVAAVAFFTTGLVWIGRLGIPGHGPGSLSRLIAATLLPFSLLAVSTLLHEGCWSLSGILLFWAFVLPASLFGAALAYALAGLVDRRRRVVFVVVGLLVAGASIAFDLGLHPQFYSYSHVFGGIVGPVYDGWTDSRSGLVTFRIVTLLWCAVLWAAGREFRSRGIPGSRLVLVISLGLLSAAYANRGVLGFNTTYASLRSALPAVHETEHFVIHYDSSAALPAPIHVIAGRQEYDYARLSTMIEEEVGNRIAVYLYPDERTRARLTGAGTTSVTPVWLRRPQIHMLAWNHEASFGHELVHVMSRPFGVPVINASTRIGLVEGLAVALEPPAMSYEPHARVRAAVQSFAWDTKELRKRARRTMSPLGFWSDRGAIAYAISGSFVDFFIDRFGIDAFKRLYRTGDYRTAVGLSPDEAYGEWADWLVAHNPVVDSRLVDRVASEFSVVSLFEQACPHVLPEAVLSLRRGDEFWQQRDMSAAVMHWEAALNDERVALPVRHRIALTALHDGDPARAERLLAGSDSSRSWLGSLLAADLLAISGQHEAAKARYDTLLAGTVSLSRAASIALRASVVNSPAAVAALYSAPAGVLDGSELYWGAARAAMREQRYDDATRHLELAATNMRQAPSDDHDPASDLRRALVDWYRQSSMGEAFEASGRWLESAAAWQGAEMAAAAPSLNRFPYAVDYGRYRAQRAAWLASRTQ